VISLTIQDLINELNKIEDKTKAIGIITTNAFFDVCDRELGEIIEKKNEKFIDKHRFDYYV
jgi:hypothetical protein